MIFLASPRLLVGATVVVAVCSWGCQAQLFPNGFSFNSQLISKKCPRDAKAVERDAFLDQLVANLTVPELGTLIDGANWVYRSGQCCV